MPLEIIRAMRLKYKPRQHGAAPFDRHPPGGADVMRLCMMVERLEGIVRDLQRQLPVEKQNEIERRIWNVALPNEKGQR